jgi:acetylornithine/N-succinyldiaminopimelate aminotransferase
VTTNLLPTYPRADLAFERGEGCWLIATDGARYLDFACGVAVNALGHAHPHLVEALCEQAKKVWHVSNLYRIPEGERLAQRLCATTFADTVFFANSGAEAMECAIKMARKFHSANGQPERFRIVTYEGAFHGRTLATLAAGGQKKYLEGFGPVVEGFDQVAFGDADATKRAIGPQTAAILIEPVQGEGGVRVASPQFLRQLRQLCREHGLLLVFDEVQTGIGRTGDLFAYQRTGVTPDVMAIAKAIGGGFPLGACLATTEAAKGMTLGTHGSTFGGNPLAMAAGNAVLDVVLAPEFLDTVRRRSLLLKQRLAELKDRYPAVIAEVRGEGMLIGLRAVVNNGDLVNELRAERLLSVAAGDNVVRLLPPLIVGEAEIAEAVAMVDRACTRLARSAAPVQQGALA